MGVAAQAAGAVPAKNGHENETAPVVQRVARRLDHAEYLVPRCVR